ncbi:MAG: O-acetyl-ADP-ribose deacetylase [Pseudomonadota bacterium]
MSAKLDALQADITTLQVDAIVNAANSSLLGGGGVDGAIHRAAGSELYHECRLLGGCKTGEAKTTKGYDLLASYVIHTVGPVWRDGKNSEEQLLESCYRNSIAQAREYSVKTIAFPSISTGIFGFPISLASRIAVETVLDELNWKPGEIEKVVFCCFSNEDLEVYKDVFVELSV